MFPKHSLILIALVLIISVLNATPVADEFNNRLRDAKTGSDAMAIVQEFLPRMTDIMDLRTLQNVWMRLDQSACAAYFLTQHTQFPESAMYHYLWIRTYEDDEFQIGEARKLINAHPEFYWGYRVLYASYIATLFDDKADPALKERIAAGYAGDKTLMINGYQRFPQDDYARIALFNLYKYEKNYSVAEQYIVQVTDTAALNANMDSIMGFIEESGRMNAFEKLVPLMISSGIAAGEINAADSTGVYDSYYIYTLGKTKNWEKVQAFYASHPQYIGNSKYNGTLLDMYIATKRYDEAISFITNALAKGDLTYTDLAEKDTWNDLRELPRWKSMLAKAKADWEATEPARKAEALKNRIDKPAPLWEFPDKDGKIVKLSDLKGQIVLLDFWATWCSPCRSTMPILDKWMRTKMPEGVQVFSVNVWEQNPPAAVKYIDDNKFMMRYLAGDEDVSKNYGFTGIPYLCIIDRDGKIAYDHSGYSEDLAQILNYWVEELNKAKQD